jgi:hypothetical protein
MSTSTFAMSDTKRPDGCYVTFTRVMMDDETADPRDRLFQDKRYRKADQKRLDAYNRGEWHFVGIRARAHVTIVRNGTSFRFNLDSAGLWGIESDSGEEYFKEVFEPEISELKLWLTHFDMSKAVVDVC